MNSPDGCIDIIRGNEVTAAHEEFINHWNSIALARLRWRKGWQKPRCIGGIEDG